MSSGNTDLLDQELPDLLRQFPVVRFIYLFNIICFLDIFYKDKVVKFVNMVYFTEYSDIKYKYLSIFNIKIKKI